jgi:hypothetical protein
MTVATRQSDKRAAMARIKRDDLDAIGLLLADHRRLRTLFRAVDAADRADHAARRALVGRACAALKRHAALEAEIFYPAARAALGADGVATLDEAAIEHRVTDGLAADLARLPPADPRYAATFAVLAAYVRLHMRQEENRLFATMRGAPELRALAARLRSRAAALAAADETPGQIEPSADAAGAFEPVLDEAVARRLAG